MSSVEASSLSYDAAHRITSISNGTNNALSWTLGYDNLDRTTSASETGASLSYSYDADGNRLTQTGASVPSPLWTAGASFTYNARGRMSSATQSVTNFYIYNAFGQMIEKSAGATTMLVYDMSGHLVGEYTGAGTLIQETIWLNDLPVATLRPNGTGISIYYVHADQLGSPRLVTRPADNVIMWRWDTDPFGTAVPNQNPQAQGTFVYNLRFPGQYYQAETGLNYNYFRDYDPGSGRYVQSDPIGLRGGSNTYAYVEGNPISRMDPTGLDDSICMFNPSMCGPQPAPLTVTHEVPSNAVLYTTPDGQTFWAPPNANFSQVTQAGQSNGLNPFAGNEAIGQFGTYDYQRSGNQFISAYTDASNYAVGAYVSTPK